MQGYRLLAKILTGRWARCARSGAIRCLRRKPPARAPAAGHNIEKALDQLGTGDVLVVAEWDRATRSMIDGVNIIERINARGALIKVLDKPHLDLTAA